MLPLSGKGKYTCWKRFIKCAHLLTGVVRDANVDDACMFIIWGWREGGQIGIGLERRRSEVLLMPGIIFL